MKLSKGLFLRTIFSASSILLIPILITCAQADISRNKYEPIDVSQFENSSHHWYDISSNENIVEPQKNQPRYSPHQIIEIGENILLYQKNNGGWPKNYDMLAILTEEQKKALIRAKNIFNTTFDNWTTHTQVKYLAELYDRTGIEKFKDACLNGIDFILASQYESGGWPQFFPDTNGYAKHITFNDGVMSGIMSVLYEIKIGKKYYGFVDQPRRDKVDTAFQKGLNCILKCQIYQNGRLTAWGQQHDKNTLKPQWARAFEPASICNGESAAVVLFLMSIENPSQKVIDAIQGAVKWFDESKIYGIRVEVKKVQPVKYRYSTFDYDRVVVEDTSAPPIWTRFYELETERPLFCNRDKKVVYTLADVEHERRAGYGWYTYDSQNVINKYAEWQQKYAPNENVLKK